MSFHITAYSLRVRKAIRSIFDELLAPVFNEDVFQPQPKGPGVLMLNAELVPRVVNSQIRSNGFLDLGAAAFVEFVQTVGKQFLGFRLVEIHADVLAVGHMSATSPRGDKHA